VTATEQAGAIVPFPTYEVPAFVAERFPGFDPADPSTWPEPEKCTEGRPWGHDAYGSVWGTPAGRWELYLGKGSTRKCRNRWRDERYRLCGTHLAPFMRDVIDSARRERARQRIEQHLDLAKRLGAYGIEADGSRSSGVLLSADAVEALLGLLAEADRVAPL
jgi:hypothetical protein